MSATSVGQIGLDLVVNSNQFQRQLSGITSLAKKAGAALAAAFAVKKLVQFGKECVELGSDLAEVQNVVDVVFPSMTSQIDAFAQNAINSFGLSETMAKKYTGTFGAMAKAFGFTEAQAYEMSTTLTGLAGDVASFYNITQDEAYTKLKSVFSGETETLKDLGVVMTQSALDAYAMANGWGKTTQAMSEAEKVALRYQFVQDQLTSATGDFARTSDSWANQVRILKLQFDSLKATIGQGLINILTPVIKVINTVIGKLSTLANAFKAFTELITGKKASDGGGTAAGLVDTANASQSVADANDAVGSSAKKAAKEMRALMGFDQVNKLSDTSGSSSGGEAGSSGGASVGDLIDYGLLAEGENVLDSTAGKFQIIVEKAKELASLFKKGFEIGFGDSQPRIDGIISSVYQINDSLREIFSDPNVQGAFSRLLESWAESAGKITGSCASIGLTIADNIIGGIGKALEGSKDFIKTRFVHIFDVKAELSKKIGDLYAGIADVFSAFSNSDGKAITGGIISIFTDSFLSIIDLANSFSADVFSIIANPFIENSDKIKTAAENTLKPIAEVVETVSDGIRDAWQTVLNMYDQHLKPLFSSFSDGISEVVSTLSDGYNVYIAPVLDELAGKFGELWDNHIQPFFGGVVEFLGKAADGIKSIWEEIIQPFLDWCAETIIPVLAPILETLGTLFMGAIGVILDTISDLLGALGGVIDFVVGVFTLDWEKAWNGIKTFFEGIWNGIKTFFGGIWDGIKNIFSPVGDWFSEKFNAAVSGIRNAFSSIGTFFSGIWSGIKNAFGNVAGWFKEKFSAAWQAVKNVFSTGGRIFDGIKDGILSGLKAVVNAIIAGINKVIAIPFDGINWALQKLRDVSIFGLTPFSWLPTISTPQIPQLAQGGYVKANTPQLAMIGDNRHQGEVVAPENKLREMALDAVKMAGIGSADGKEIISLLKQLITLVMEGEDMVLYVDSEELARSVQGGAARLKRRYGKVEFV